MHIGFYCGSFDPFTNGHLHIIKTASHLFEKVIVGIGENTQKQRRYEKEKIKEAMEAIFQREQLFNVEIVCYNNLSIDTALAHHANFLIRGIRNDMDYAYEENLSQINEELSGLDTIYLRSSHLGFISSSMIFDLVRNGKDVSPYVPKEILPLLLA